MAYSVQSGEVVRSKFLPLQVGPGSWGRPDECQGVCPVCEKQASLEELPIRSSGCQEHRDFRLASTEGWSKPVCEAEWRLLQAVPFGLAGKSQLGIEQTCEYHVVVAGCDNDNPGIHSWSRLQAHWLNPLATPITPTGFYSCREPGKARAAAIFSTFGGLCGQNRGQFKNAPTSHPLAFLKLIAREFKRQHLEKAC